MRIKLSSLLLKRPRTRRARVISIAFLLLVLVFGFIIVKRAFGVTRTWDGGCGGDTSWSCDANWSGDTRPGASDLALFDTFDGNATVDATFAGSVGGVQITSSYDGEITQSRSLIIGSQNFNQAGGTWTSGAQTLDIDDGSFTVSGGTHTATTGTWTVERNLTYSGGTLTMTGATVTFNGTLSDDDSTTTCTGSLGGTVAISKTGGGDFTNASGCTVTVSSVSMSSGFLTNNGTFNHTGTLFNLDDDSTLDTGLINNSGATMTFSGTSITIEGSLTQSGTFNLTGITVTFDGAFNWMDSTTTCTGSLGGTVAISKTGGGDFTNASGCTVTVSSVSMSGGFLTNNGTFNHTGTLFNLDDDSTLDTGLINNSGATMTFSGTSITIEGSLTQSGTFNLTGITVTFDGAFNWHDSTVTCSTDLGSGFALAKTGDGDFTLASGCTATIDSTDAATNVGDVTINGNLTVNNGSADTLPIGNASGNDLTNNGTLTIGTNVTLDMGNDIDNNGALTVNGGLKTDFNLDSTGGTIAGSGTITFEAATVATNLDSILTCSGTIGPSINVAKIENGQDFTLSSGCSITLSSSVTTIGSIINNGTINGTNLNINENLNTSSGTVSLSGTLTFYSSDVATNNDSTLTCGSSPITGNVTVNKTTGGQVTVIASDCTITGNFTRTDGEFDNPAAAYTLTVQGNFSMSTTDLFGGNNLTLVMGGSGATQTMTQNAGAINNNIQINKSSGTASLSTNLITNGVATVSAGIFDLNSRNFTAGQGFSVSDGATLELYGSETTTLPTLNTGSTVKYTGDGDSLVDNYILKDLGYYHLTIASVDSSDTYATPNATEDVDGNFTVLGGVFTAPSSNFTIGGNFAHSGGTFTHNSGTVTFDTTSQTSNISGNTTFNNLSSTTAGKKITVANGSTQTVSGTFTLTGSAGNRIRLTGTQGGSQWNLAATGQSVSYVEARDSSACGGTTITATNSIDLGNNSCWTFFAGANPPSEVKMQRGVNIRRGTTIQRN